MDYGIGFDDLFQNTTIFACSEEPTNLALLVSWMYPPIFILFQMSSHAMYV